jgi:hypothetical protein
MNCSVCGSPLLFDRVVFRCECGAYIHAYCADKHIVDSHRPELEEGYADLNGEFHLKHQPVAVAVAALEEGQASDAEAGDEEGEGEVFEEELVADADVSEVTEGEVEDEAETDDGDGDR